MEETKRSTVSSLAGTVLMQVALCSLFAFFFFYLLISFIPGDSALLVSTILGILFIFWVSGSSGKNAAERDHNMIVYGHEKPFLLKGFLSGLLAQIPGAILLILYACLGNEACGVIYRLLYNSSLYLLSIFETQPALYTLSMVPFPLACGFGYLWGYYQAEKRTPRKLG